MTLPRRILINADATPYYHCVSRCVRRAFLCGRDELTGFDFEHRRQWIESRLNYLAQVFAIDLCAYAVMSNHYHVVLHLNCDEQATLDEDAVVDRWSRIHRLPDWFQATSVDDPRRIERIALWRDRLGSISWFMKCINEPLARWANKEDDCKGRFWEGRFRSQALLDEASVLRCMVYVDLNPIRAGIAASPENSDHTSIKARIRKDKASLAAMEESPSAVFVLPISRAVYIELVDWTGRQMRRDKRGAINSAMPPILTRLRCDRAEWMSDMKSLMRRYARAVGSVASLLQYRTWLGQTRLNGVTSV